MPDIMINHQRVGPIGQNNGKQIYQVKLDPPTKYVEKGEYDTSNRISFNRMDSAQNHGFKVEMFDSSNNMTAYETKNASPVVINVPDVGTYYYKIYYPWDVGLVEVLPLDPVIIIEPKKSLQLAQLLLPALAGAAIAAVACYVLLN